jgi:hypothetical protein
VEDRLRHMQRILLAIRGKRINLLNEAKAFHWGTAKSVCMLPPIQDFCQNLIGRHPPKVAQAIEWPGWASIIGFRDRIIRFAKILAPV